MNQIEQKAIQTLTKRISQACQNSDHFPALPLTPCQILYFERWILPALKTLGKESKDRTFDERDHLELVSRSRS